MAEKPVLISTLERLGNGETRVLTMLPPQSRQWRSRLLRLVRPRPPEPAEIVVLGALGEPERPGDLALAPTLIEREAEGLEHSFLGKSLCWHCVIPDGSLGGEVPAVSARALNLHPAQLCPKHVIGLYRNG